MASVRLVASLVVLLVALGGAAALAAWAIPEAGAAGAYPVEVVGPGGRLFQENVTVEGATVLLALEAACAKRGVNVEMERFPGMGTYVRAIDGHRADGATGWVYEVLRGGAWTNGDRSAEFFALQRGDAVRWSWV